MRHLSVLLLFVLLSASLFGQNHVNPSYRQGFSFEVESGYADNGGYFDISSGCNIIHGLYVGLGAGYERHDFIGKLHTMVPTYIQVRYSFVDETVSPFVEMKVGIKSDFSHNATGHFFRPAVGVEYRHFGLKLGYDWTQVGYEIDNCAYNEGMYTIGVFYRF